MVACIGQDRTLRRETVRGLMQRHAGEDVVQHPVLRAFEPRHRRRDQALAAGLLGDAETLIMIDRRHRAIEGEKAQLGQRDAHRVGQRPGVSECGQARRPWPRGLLDMKSGGDTFAEIQHVAFAPLVPRLRPILPRLGVAALGLLAPCHRLGLAALVHFLQRTLRITQQAVLPLQFREFADRVRAFPDCFSRRRGRGLAIRPETEPDHFLEDDFILRGLPDPIV